MERQTTSELNGEIALMRSGAQGIGLSVAREFLSGEVKAAITDVELENMRVTAESLTTEFGKNVQSKLSDVEKMVGKALKKIASIFSSITRGRAALLVVFWRCLLNSGTGFP